MKSFAPSLQDQRSLQSDSKPRPIAKTALKVLRQLDLEAKERKYPGQPYLVPHQFTEKTSNGLTFCVIMFLQLKGHQAERINTTGRPIDRRYEYTDVLGHRKMAGSIQWIPGTSTRGSADISATIQGRSVKIEIKVGRDRMSEHQQRYKEAVEKAGGIYIVVTSFDQFYSWYMKIYG
jgi:hypothetical protein